MAAVYKFKVECCSAFCSYPDSHIQKLIENALKSYVNPDTGLTLESISVKKADTYEASRRQYGLDVDRHQVLQKIWQKLRLMPQRPKIS